MKKKHLAPQLALTPEKVHVNNVLLEEDDVIRIWHAYLASHEITPSLTKAIAKMVARGLRDWGRENGVKL